MSYDVFLSHTHVDKDWVRALHDVLAKHDYNGRNLRAWLDERVLDPGELSSLRELHSALDRSRILVLVASPDAVQSTWVQNEIDYFVDTRGAGSVVVILRQNCKLPDLLEPCPVIDWPGEVTAGDPLNELVAAVCSESDYQEFTHRKQIRRAWQEAYHRQPAGLDATHTDANAKLAQQLLSYDISNPAQEGPALVGFDRLAELLVDIDGQEHYGSKMVVGEFLAVAALENPGYRAVAARFVDMETRTTERPTLMQMRDRLHNPRHSGGAGSNLLFAVARSASKLAEIDPDHLDLATLWAALHGLDQRADLSGPEKALSMMIGRTLAKIRGSALAHVLIHSLARYGRAASRIAAATAIAGRFEDDRLFYTAELAERAQTALPQHPVDVSEQPPSASLAALLIDGALRDPLDRYLSSCRDELIAALADSVEDDHAIPLPSFGPAARYLANGPIVGTVRRVELANMEAIAPRLGPSDIACLVEPRVVDDLLGGAGCCFIETQDDDSPLCQRLRNRRSRFAMLDRGVLDGLADGDCVSIPVPHQQGAVSMGLKIAST